MARRRAAENLTDLADDVVPGDHAVFERQLHFAHPEALLDIVSVDPGVCKQLRIDFFFSDHVRADTAEMGAGFNPFLFDDWLSGRGDGDDDVASAHRPGQRLGSNRARREVRCHQRRRRSGCP